MRNADFQLCADGGLADKAREYTKNYKTEAIQVLFDAFDKFMTTGRMPFTPNIAGPFADFYGNSRPADGKHNIEVARDTLFSILAERKKADAKKS